MPTINNIEELIQNLKSGTLLEHRYQNLELKENWHREDGKKISAMGNRKADGSQWLCVGIKDKGELGGYDYKSVKAIEENISNHLNEPPRRRDGGVSQNKTLVHSYLEQF